jgi:hypothetical protein
MNTAMNASTLPIPTASTQAHAIPAEDYPQVPRLLTWAFGLYILVWYLEFGQRVALLGAIRFEFILGAH